MTRMSLQSVGQCKPLISRNVIGTTTYLITPASIPEWATLAAGTLYFTLYALSRKIAFGYEARPGYPARLSGDDQTVPPVLAEHGT